MDKPMGKAHCFGIYTVIGYLILFGIVKLIRSSYECFVTPLGAVVFLLMLLLIYALGRSIYSAVKQNNRKSAGTAAGVLAVMIVIFLIGSKIFGIRLLFWFPM